MKAFLYTKMENGRLRMLCCEGQGLDVTKHVAGDKRIRETFPEGTVFHTDYLTDQGTYYKATALSVVCSPSAGRIYNAGKNIEWLDLLSTIATTETPVKTSTPAAAPKAEASEWSPFLPLFDEGTAASVRTETVKPAARKTTSPKPKAKAETEVKKLPKNIIAEIRKMACYALPTVEDDGFWIDRNKWELLCRNILKRKNVLLTGPAGTGKTKIVRLAAERLGLNFHWYDMGITRDPVTTLIGTHRIMDGKSVFDWADFVQQIQKPGIILLDEFSRATPIAHNILFPVLDERRTLRAEMASGTDKREIKVHPECIFIATANLGDEYTGVTDEIDLAALDRFFKMEMTTIPEQEEVKLLIRQYGIKPTDASNIVKVATMIRKMSMTEEIHGSISTRHTLELAEMIADGYTIREALELHLLPLYSGTDADGDRGLVKKIIMSN